MLILVIGFFYVPSTIYAFSETEKREDAFSEILVKYVLFPLTILIFAIIYLYVIKIFILRNVPSNELFSILAGFYSGNANMDDDGVYRKGIFLAQDIRETSITIYTVGILSDLFNWSKNRTVWSDA